MSASSSVHKIVSVCIAVNNRSIGVCITLPLSQLYIFKCVGTSVLQYQHARWGPDFLSNAFKHMHKFSHFYI